jgi:hypothetical protein
VQLRSAAAAFAASATSAVAGPDGEQYSRSSLPEADDALPASAAGADVLDVEHATTSEKRNVLGPRSCNPISEA